MVRANKYLAAVLVLGPVFVSATPGFAQRA